MISTEAQKLLRIDFARLIQVRDCDDVPGMMMATTPLVTLNGHCVSVFIKHDLDTYDISDGEWLVEGFYFEERQEPPSLDTVHLATKRLVDQYKIKFEETRGTFYKRVHPLIVSSAVFDMAHFIQATVNSIILKEAKP